MMKGCAEATRAQRHQDDREPEPGDGRRHRHVRRLPRQGRRTGQVRLRRRPRLRRPPGRLRRPDGAAGALSAAPSARRSSAGRRAAACARAIRPEGGSARDEPEHRSTCGRAPTADAAGGPHGRKEEDDPHHPAGAHADARAGPEGRARATSRRSPAATRSRTRCARPSAACNAPDEPCVRGCPVGIDIPAFIQKITEKHFHGAYDVITDTNLLPSVCGRVCPQEAQCEGVCTVGATRWSRSRSGASSASSATWRSARAGRTFPTSSPRAFKVGIVGSGPAGMACAADMAKAGCEVDRLRGVPQAGRRAQVRHSGLPAAERRHRRRDREAAQPRRALRVQHAGRAPVHDRADGHRDGLPRGVHRHRRGLSELHGHSRRVAERRAVGQRAAHALQPDARARLPELRHAAAARQARRRDRRRQHRDGRAARVAAAGRRKRPLHLPPHARRKRRRVSRKSTTRRRKAWSSTG